MKLSNEAKIGIMVFFVLTILAVLTIKTGDFKIRKKGYEVKVHIRNIDGVEKNSPVRLNGMEVGLVKDMQILYGGETKMELTLWIKEGIKVHDGSRAFVKNMGLFGEKYIALSIGDTEKEFVAPGAVIPGVEPPNFEKIMADGEVIAANFKEISENLNERLKVNSESIDEIIADFRVSMRNVKSITTNLNERAEVNKDHIDSLIANLDSTSRNLDEMSYDLKLNPWKLMFKEKEKKFDYKEIRGKREKEE